MEVNLFRGDKVELTIADPEEMAKLFSQWNRNTVFSRLASFEPAAPFSVKGIKDWLEKNMLEDPGKLPLFLIRTIEDGRIIGEIGLEPVKFHHSNTLAWISIGEPGDWGKGYGTDAMRIILRYAFAELNFHRVSLLVFEYNHRAIRSYEKAGFQVEGRQRQQINRDGQRWDVIAMGILQSEWKDQNGGASQ